MGKERKVTLENTYKTAPKPHVFNGCAQLSVNVEVANRAGFCGLRRKNAVNNARYLRDGWKTHRAGKRLASPPAHHNDEVTSHG